MHDLLHDPLIGVRTASGPTRLSLPDLLASLSSGAVVEHTGLRAHQSDPWHVFLVQIAASVMARQPAGAALPVDTAAWRAGLLDLADGQASAWQLVVEDVTRPAFMQHPLRVAVELAQFKPKASTPDELDVLVTAKDHDVKGSRMDGFDPEAWLHALLAFQTLSGFLGAGNYGSVRMNGGFGSRSIISLISDPAPSPRFREEVEVLRAMSSGGEGRGLGFATRGVALTWLTPWSGETSQWSIGQLEPWFVESVRRVRLVAHGDAVIALGATTEARQVGPKTLDNGDVGDPWLPINLNDKKKGRSALTVSAAAWSPEMLCRLLFQEGIALTALQRPRPGMRGGSWFVGSVLVRGQGTTEGFHRFSLPVPARTRGWLARGEDRDRLAGLAKELIADAKEVERTLRGALMVLGRGGPESLDFKDDTLQAWSRAALDAELLGWKERFFPTLWRAADDEAAAVRAEWQDQLVTRARDALDDALRRMPCPSSRRYRAQVRARSYLEGVLRKKGLTPQRAESPTQEVTQ
jgi:CRISPR system Cascade subunit CasA